MPDAYHVTIETALQDATAQFQAVDPHTAALDARLLLQHVLQCDWHELVLNKTSPLSDTEMTQWHTVIAERLQQKSVAKIIGFGEFHGMPFKTTFDTLDPRPDSETLIAIVERAFADHGNPLRVLDLGTGTGCLLLTVLRLYPQSTGIGADLSDAALTVASENAETHHLKDRVQFVQSNWFQNITGPFDLIISNPPYIDHATLPTLPPAVITHEPMLALSGGKDGLDAYRIIVAQAHEFLKPGGWLTVEIGYDQAESVNDLFTEHNFANVHVYYDLSGHPRVVSGQRII